MPMRWGGVPPAGGARKKLRILAVSDMESKFIWEHFDRSFFEGVDLILSCGDLKASYLSYLVTMLPVPLYYVHGNHDGAYDRDPPQGCECIDGRAAEVKGLRIAGLGGCLGSDPTNPYQFTEPQMARRVKKLQSELRRDKKIDIFVSHAPAAGVGDVGGFHGGFWCFHELYRLSAPGVHLFGHVHSTVSPIPGSQASYPIPGGIAYNCTGYRFIDVFV